MAAIIDDVRMRLEANGPECRMDEVLELCPDLTWNQVFLAIDYLNRTGQVRLMMDRARRYRVRIRADGRVPGTRTVTAPGQFCAPKA